MEFIVTQAQLTTFKGEMGAQAVCVYSMDGTETTKVGRFALLDPKLGGISLAWTSIDIAPTEAEFLVICPGAVKLSVIV